MYSAKIQHFLTSVIKQGWPTIGQNMSLGGFWECLLKGLMRLALAWHWLEFQRSFLWPWGDLEDGSHKLMKPEHRHKSLGSYDCDSPELHNVVYEKTNPQFCKGTLFLGQFSMPTETDFRSQSGSLQWPIRALFDVVSPLPLLYLPDLISYHSLLHILYSSPMASSLCTSGTLQPPRLCTCCSPTWSTTALQICLASSFPSSKLLLKIPFPVLLP